VIAAVIYAIGWGPTLAVGLLVGVADNIRESGSRAVLPSVFWSVLGIGLGELAIFTGVAPSLVDEPLVHGLALLAALGLVFTIVVLGWITAEKQHAEMERGEAEERFRRSFEDAPIGMGLADPEGRLFRVNSALAELLGYRSQDLLGVRIADITHPDDWPANQHEMRRLFAGETSSYCLEKRYFHADGHVLWVLVSVSLVRAADGNPLYMIGQIEDITERKAIAERLEHAAIHDPLTELPNRVLLADRLSLALSQSHRRRAQVGVIFLDLDRFKLINDSLGHAAGDELLTVLSERLQGSVRPGDTVARFGGDEFVVVCHDPINRDTVLDVAQRVGKAVARPAIVNGREVFVTASVGVVISKRASDTPEELLRDADAAMYRAKELGRDRIEVFDERSHRQAMEQLETGADLHHALERNELEVHYQPIVDLETGRVSGFEALVRWRHPIRGLIQPVGFVDFAEETGLIVPIGNWVLEEACREAVRWQSRRRGGECLSISVNVAPRQLAEPTLADDLAQVLRRTAINPETVWLELTEGALSHDATSTIGTLKALRAQGVHLAVDDFGTGYSSLGHLKRFPVEMLKVDQTFVDGLGREAEDTSIVGAVVNLAHSLGLTAVAEGLETQVQLGELRTMGCDYAQGDLFGAPKLARVIGDQPADDLSSWQVAEPS
jgi:diguanylate cyclase (GGDEF)-like protein/PAS domain S-box-containing protein